MEGQPCIANPQLLETPHREFQREKAPPLLWSPADKPRLSQWTRTDLNGVCGGKEHNILHFRNMRKLVCFTWSGE